MDFKTRDLYRKEIETLSFATGRDEKELAESTLDLARKSAAAEIDSVVRILPDPAGFGNPLNIRRAHVGEYLLGKGRPAL
jgi:hypothetical protein